MGAKRIIPRQLSLTDNDCSWQIFVYDRKNWELNPINREGKKQSVICSIWSQILIDWGVPSLISLMVSVDVKHHVYLLRLGRGAYKCAEHGLCPFPLTHLFLKDTVRGSGLRGDNSSSLHTRSIARSSLSSAPVTAVMKSFSHDANSSSLFRVCQLFVGSIALQSKQPAVRKSVRLQNWSMCTPLIQKGQVQNVCQSRVPHYGNTKIAQRAHKAYEQSLSVSGEWRYIYKSDQSRNPNIVQELCESRGGRPGLSVLTSLLVSVDVKQLSTSIPIAELRSSVKVEVA